jgi:hypothetical protein
MSLLFACQVCWSNSSICTWVYIALGLDPADRFLALPGSLFIKATWCSFPRLAALVATAILMSKADKLTLGQELTVHVPHSVLKHSEEILKLLEAVWVPKWVAVMKCWGHQKGETTAVWGNEKADKEAKWASLRGGKTSASITAALFSFPLPNGTHGTHHKNRLGLRVKREIFYQTNGGSLPAIL